MNMIATPAQQEAFKTSYKKIQELNVEREDHRAAKQKLNTQLSENNMVMAELKLLKDDAVIYKMVGPALIKQDPEEVKLNVRNRLNHINGEMERHQNCIKKCDEKSSEIEKDMRKLEDELAKQMEAAGLIKKQ